jgi:hypothetical protein
VLSLLLFSKIVLLTIECKTIGLILTLDFTGEGRAWRACFFDGDFAMVEREVG